MCVVGCGRSMTCILEKKKFWATEHVGKMAVHNEAVEKMDEKGRHRISVPMCLSKGFMEKTLQGTMTNIMYLLRHVLKRYS